MNIDLSKYMRDSVAGLSVPDGIIERMDASFLCGPDSEPAYCLTPAGWRRKREAARKPSTDAAER